MKRFILILLLCVLLVATTFGLDLSLGPGLSVKNAFLYLIMVVYMIETAVLHNRRFELPSVLLPFGLLVGYCILSWFTASFVVHPSYYNPFPTLITLKGERVDQLIVFLLFFYGVASTRDTLILTRAFLLILALGSLVTVVDGFNIPDLGIIQQREDGRMGGPMGESNQYGALLAFMLPGAVALLWDPGIKKWLAIGTIFISIVALLAASSRGSFAGLFLGGAFTVFYLRSIITLRQIALGVTALIITLAITLVVILNTELAGNLIDRFVDVTTARDARTMSSGRTAIWANLLGRMTENPLSFLTGFGWDAYRFQPGIFAAPHNTYLNVMFNLGLPGLCLYLLLLHMLFRSARRAIWRATGLARAHLMAFTFGFAALNASLLFVEIYQPWVYIWAYAGLMMRLSVESVPEATTEKLEDTRSLRSFAVGSHY